MRDLLIKAVKHGLHIRFLGEYRVSYNDEKNCFQYWDFGYFNISDDDLGSCTIG